MKTVIIFTLVSIFSSLAYAQDASDADPEKVIKYRQDFMTAVKGHNNGIKSIVTGAVPFTGHLDIHLDALEKLFAEIPALFPEGSDFGDTNAKDAVWDNPEKFEKAVSDSQQALQDFKQVVAAGDMTQTSAAFKEFGKASCGGCHKGFKKKDK